MLPTPFLLFFQKTRHAIFALEFWGVNVGTHDPLCRVWDDAFRCLQRFFGLMVTVAWAFHREMVGANIETELKHAGIPHVVFN